MKTSLNGRKLIESFEGLILQSYDDYNDHIVNSGDTVHGVLTIGYGHTSVAGAPHVSIGDTITQSDADRILGEDLKRVEDEVNRLVHVPLNQNQFDALVSFEFNTGALGHSSALPLLNAGNYVEAADHLLLYNQAGGRVLAGLIRRRKAEHELFMSQVTLLPDTPTKPTTDVPMSSWNMFVDYYYNLIMKLFIKGK
jgi:lysozyme